MTLKVIGAGLGRTGTLSLKLALEQLGFGPCYHMAEVFPHANRVQHWNDVTAGKPVDWDEVFAGFQATVDWPACNYYRELMAKYPDAKVLLSVRPSAEKWFESTQATIFADRPPGVPTPDFIPRIINAKMGPDWHDKDACIAAYERHNAEVRAYVPQDRLLEFRPNDGWAPLCAWLGVAVPATPYPSVNSTEEFQGRWRNANPGKA